MVGHLADVITYAKFQDDIFRGCDFTGDRISHFPIDYAKKFSRPVGELAPTVPPRLRL